MLQKLPNATADLIKAAEQSSLSLDCAVATQLRLPFCGWDKMLATFETMPYGYAKKKNDSSTLEGLRALQKVREEKGVWPGEMGIRPKFWVDLVGEGKGLLGPKAWEVEHWVSSGWGRLWEGQGRWAWACTRPQMAYPGGTPRCT